MSTNSAARNVRDVEDVSSRVRNTKREIEQLKNELEQLFNVGAQLNPINTNREKKLAEKILPLPVFSKEPSTGRQKSPSAVTNKIETNKTSPRKSKNYNPVEAREYIKKQKEKRAEQLRAQINFADTKVSIKKDKLRELHERARELVSKNVQLKRERSKSREPPPVRFDKTSPRHKSTENLKKTNFSRSQERQRQVSATRTKSASREGIKAPQERNGPTNERTSRPRIRKKPAETVTSGQNVGMDHLRPPEVKLGQMDKTAFPPAETLKGSEVDHLRPPEVDRNSLVFPPKEEADEQSKERSSSRGNKPETLPASREKPPEVKKPKPMPELAVMTDACVKDTKETQTSRTNNFDVPWMQPPKVLPYPYNFISTVKKKLQHAINSPVTSDVIAQTPEVKSKEEIKEMLIQSAKSELKSFASHKGPNLDLKEIDNLGLVSKFHKSDKDGASRKLLYDSDSDTSKNIPDISSESLSVHSKPNLSLSKVKDLNLKSKPPSESNGYSEGDKYSSDFQKESINNEKSDSSIKTVLSEKKPPEPEGSDETIKTTRSTKSRKSKIKDFFSSSSKKQSFESLNLKEPSVSLTVRTDQNSSEKSGFLKKSTSLMSSIKKNTKILLNRESREHSDETLKSLLLESDSSKSTTDSVPESLKNSKSSHGKEVNLRKPPLGSTERNEIAKSQMKNITIRHATPTNNVNEIHLKFEAEVRLLNDFNESFKQFTAAKQAFENFKSKQETNLSMTKILQNVDTQTSVITRTSTNVTRDSSVNFSRGSEIGDDVNSGFLSHSLVTEKTLPNISLSNDWNLSKLGESSNISVDEGRNSDVSVANIENFDAKNCNIVSLNVFDQLIKDEDSRIQQLKVIIKIREQALLDRTKTELVWLEVQRKHLIETGKIQEASLLKKKQRGILIKHEQERNEIRKLRQMQKEASEHRKNTLKQQRNLVKTQLSTNMSKITVKKREERRSVGPLRVVQSCSESIHSETSTSLKSSIEDVLNVTLKSVKISESSELDVSMGDVDVSNAKRTLLMREAALQKRRKAAEELLRWHRKLLDEERKINELEAAATSVVKQASEDKEKHRFKGKQLQQLWRNMTGSDEKKFDEDKVYVMSQVALERFCESARQYSNKNKKAKSSEANSEGEKSGKSDDVNYSSGFEAESVQEIINSQGEKTQISSISELIDNFSKIEDEISTLSKKSEDFGSVKEDLDRSSQSNKSMTPNQPEEDISERTLSGTSDFKDTTGRETSVITTEKEQDPTDSILEEASSAKDDANTPEDEEVSSSKESISEDENLNQSASPEVSTLLEKNKTDDNEIIINEDPVEEPANLTFIKEKLEEVSLPESQDVEESSPQLTSTREETELVTEQEQTQTAGTVEDSEDSNQKITEDRSLSPLSVSTDESVSIKDTKKDLLELEEALESASKIEESLTKLNNQLTSEKAPEDISILKKDKETSSTDSEPKTPKKDLNQIDVKKRVSEILADASLSRGDKSPRLQDLYVTAYDVGGAVNSPDETNEEGRQLPTDIFGSEAEELWKKQLAIEQEIKQIEQQQKGELPYVFMREIPNKPPPPYTPPSSSSSLPQTILPADVKEITEVASYSSTVLYKAYQNNNLEKVKFSEHGFKLFSNVEVAKGCAEFMFNICKDVVRDHYKQFETVEEPSWMSPKKPQLVRPKPADASGLEKMLNQTLKELFGFKKVHIAESAIIKWGRKKRDHVDEVLVAELLEENSQWSNFDEDELCVKNQLTEDIMKMLLEETATVFTKILSKKKPVVD